MKFHKLYKPVDIVDSSDKAVKVNVLEFDDRMGKAAALINGSGGRTYQHKKPMWVPKSQIEIKNNQVVAMTKWYYNQTLIYIDSPFCLEEDFYKECEYASYYNKRIGQLTELKNKVIKENK